MCKKNRAIDFFLCYVNEARLVSTRAFQNCTFSDQAVNHVQ